MLGIGSLVVDLETYSPINIKTQGAAKYAEHPDTRIICAAFGLLAPGAAVPDKLHLWWAGEDLPQWVADALEFLPVIAHNAAFERMVLQHHNPPGWPVVPLERWHCTQAMCGMRALPLALEEVAIVLGLAEKKDRRGKYLITKCCTPQKKPPTPELLEELGAYCLQDVRTEAHLAHAIGWQLPADERELWLVDQMVNDRGLPLDVPLARAIDRIADWLEDQASERLAQLTGGVVTSLTQNKALAQWAGMKSVSKAALATHDGELSAEVREALTLRPRTSLRKARKALGAMCADGRVRHAQQYHAATTGRWGGRLVQPHNFVRPVVKDPQFETIVRFSPEDLALIYGWKWVEDQAISCLRGIVAAKEGKTLTRADLAAIEARVVLWLAGEEDAIEKYRQGVDLYCDFASTLHGKTVVKGDMERAHGKIGILGCGFQAGAARLYKQATEDGVPGVTMALIKSLVDTYRTRYSRVKTLWENMNAAACACLEAGGQWVEVEGTVVPVAFRIARGPAGHVWMQCRLPSGRLLHYFDPSLTTGRYGGPAVQWWAMKPGKSGGRKWTQVQGYGGFYTENVVQAIARDIVAGAFIRLERSGWMPVFLVHDEVVCDSDIEAALLEAFLAEPVAWAPGLPIAAEGAKERRFAK